MFGRHHDGDPLHDAFCQQLTCDAHKTGCFANVSVHPEDRFANQYDPGKPIDGVVIVGIDDASVRAIGKYPLPRDRYADALLNLEKAGAQVVAFDVGFTDPSGADKKLAEKDIKGNEEKLRGEVISLDPAEKKFKLNVG